MVDKIYDYDPAQALTNTEAIEVFLNDAFETGDANHIAKAIGVVARSQGMSSVAKDTGLSREQLYKSFSDQGNPTLKSTLAVMKALGLHMITHADVQ